MNYLLNRVKPLSFIFKNLLVIIEYLNIYGYKNKKSPRYLHRIKRKLLSLHPDY